MKWIMAVEQMRQGRQVRQVSESVRTRTGEMFGIPTFVEGREPLELVEAWTADMVPVLVLRGAWSATLYKPTNEMLSADDWIVLPP